MISIRRFFVLVLLTCIIHALTAKTYVVSVGISSYQNISSLTKPDKDAKAVAELFRRKTRDVILITGKYATKEKIQKSLRDQFSRALADDVIIFFFSGHGFKGGICPYDMTRDIRTGLSYQEIAAILRLSKARSKIIIADACFSGGLRNEPQAPSQSNGIGRDSNVILFLSSRGNETSIESRFMTNGYFTKALVRGLKGGADANRDRRITAQEIFQYVSQDVQTQSQGQQHPVMWGKFNDGFVLMDWR